MCQAAHNASPQVFEKLDRVEGVKASKDTGRNRTAYGHIFDEVKQQMELRDLKWTYIEMELHIA